MKSFFVLMHHLVSFGLMRFICTYCCACHARLGVVMVFIQIEANPWLFLQWQVLSLLSSHEFLVATVARP